MRSESKHPKLEVRMKAKRAVFLAVSAGIATGLLLALMVGSQLLSSAESKGWNSSLSVPVRVMALYPWGLVGRDLSEQPLTGDPALRVRYEPGCQVMKGSMKVDASNLVSGDIVEVWVTARDSSPGALKRTLGG